MKKTIIALLLAAALSCGICGCAQKKETVKTYKSGADFAELGLALEAPDGAQNKKYGVVESTNSNTGENLNIAQITYSYEGIDCQLRTANVGSYNVSGYDESKASNEEEYDLNLEEYSSKIRVMQINDQYVALWFLGDHSYSLSAKTGDSITFTSCALDAANANVPGTVPVSTSSAE